MHRHTAHPSPSTLPAPRALLLDFGGVIARTEARPGWAARVAREVTRLIPEAPAAAETAADIVRAAQLDADWKRARSADPAPAELTPERFWGDFVAGDWQPAAQRGALAHAAVLCDAMVRERERRTLQPGMDRVFAAARAARIPVGIVSNTLSARVYRACVAAWGLVPDTEVYSVEAGVRKPNPELIRAACRALGVLPGDTWFVGDTHDRDVACGARAGVGLNVLLRSPRTAELRAEAARAEATRAETARGETARTASGRAGPVPAEPEPEPDVTLSRAEELLELLRRIEPRIAAHSRGTAGTRWIAGAAGTDRAAGTGRDGGAAGAEGDNRG